MPERHSDVLVIRPAAGSRPMGMDRASLPRHDYAYRGTGHDMTGQGCYCGKPRCPAETGKDTADA